MERILISELDKKLNENVKIEGWVHRIRLLKNISFLILRDRTGLVQCVIDKSIDLSSLKSESVISIEGQVSKGKNDLHDFEIHVSKLDILSLVKDDLPIEINTKDLNVSLETMLNNRVLSMRQEKVNAIFKVQNIIVKGFRDFLNENDFTEIFSPKIVAEGAEGGTALFKVDYFGRKAYLSQSPQFYKEMMVSAGYERVFEIGNFFRAEEHDTVRHLNQFTSMDLEMGFINDENDLMDLEENLLKYIFNCLEEKGSKYFKLLNAKIPDMKNKIPRIEFSEAVKILKDNYNKIVAEDDFDPESEKLLCKYASLKYASDFIFVKNYSRKKRPMYTMPKGENGTRSFDLLFRGTEITSGSQRIHEYDMLIDNFKYKGLDYNDFTSYVSIFKYGVPPHGGLAIGLERLTALLLNLKNIREASIFPRDQERLIP